MTSEVAALQAIGVEKRYPSGESELHVLRGVDLTVRPGEAVAIVGQSGSGKSTLLHLLGALDLPSAGEVRVGGAAVGGMQPEQLAELRNRRIGFVFQFHHLLREFSALENVMMPMMIGGTAPAAAAKRGMELLEAVGLTERAHHAPTELSGGEQQRVAVARALANEPVVLLADEPSGNLDRETSQRLHDLLFELKESRGLAMVLVTHDLGLAERADRVLTLVDGQLSETGAALADPGGVEESGTGVEGSGSEANPADVAEVLETDE